LIFGVIFIIAFKYYKELFLQEGKRKKKKKGNAFVKMRKGFKKAATSTGVGKSLYNVANCAGSEAVKTAVNIGKPA
jgi:hypothetical protein